MAALQPLMITSDPRTNLPLVVLPLPYYSQLTNMQDIILHWFADVDKQNAKGVVEKRAAMITDRAVYIFFVSRGRANITRCIAVSSILQLIIQEDWLNIQVPTEYDIRLRPPSQESLREGVRILQVLYNFSTGKVLNVSEATKDDDLRGRLKLKKPPGWSVVMLPLRTKKSLVHALAKAQGQPVPTETCDEIKLAAMASEPEEPPKENPKQVNDAPEVRYSMRELPRSPSPSRPRPVSPRRSPTVSPTKPNRNTLAVKPVLLPAIPEITRPVSPRSADLRIKHLEGLIEGLLSELADLRFKLRDTNGDNDEICVMADNEFQCSVTNYKMALQTHEGLCKLLGLGHTQSKELLQEVTVRLQPQESTRTAERQLSNQTRELSNLIEDCLGQKPTYDADIVAMLRQCLQRKVQINSVQIPSNAPEIEAKKALGELLDKPGADWATLLPLLQQKLQTVRSLHADHTELLQALDVPIGQDIAQTVQSVRKPVRSCLDAQTMTTSHELENLVHEKHTLEQRLLDLEAQELIVRTERDTLRATARESKAEIERLREQLPQDQQQAERNWEGELSALFERCLSLQRTIQTTEGGCKLQTNLLLEEFTERMEITMAHSDCWIFLSKRSHSLSKQLRKIRQLRRNDRAKLEQMERRMMQAEEGSKERASAIAQLQAMHHRACDALKLEKQRCNKLQEQLAALNARYHEICSNLKSEMQAQITDLTGQIHGLQREVTSPRREHAANTNESDRLKRWASLGERVFENPSVLPSTAKRVPSFGSRNTAGDILQAMEALRLQRQLGSSC
eukprot:TRINITY_DN2777_c0_g1_i1.p1 TRINITY_DN2777_c0_g1~~TRINITY_DN2777_c0_g1_i1.p1  ORF type:complete len:795 (+),score=117.19 TRINITY_DN2777_c0_g1_i1:43-2427(+)